jgi:hypothetical protein
MDKIPVAMSFTGEWREYILHLEERICRLEKVVNDLAIQDLSVNLKPYHMTQDELRSIAEQIKALEKKEIPVGFVCKDIPWDKPIDDEFKTLELNKNPKKKALNPHIN